MIDTHAHIDTEAFDADREQMLQRAWAEGIESIILPDIKPPTRPKLKTIVDANPKLYRGVGIHPHHVHEGTEEELEYIEQQLAEQRVVAIGEIGLDYYYNFCSPMIQKSYFRKQLQIAKRNNLPVIIHDRESSSDLLQIIEEEQDGNLRGVLHCFSGDTQILQRAMSLGMHISFTGNITFKKSTLTEVVAAVPTDRFMIETDSPYITPVPHRGKRNEPSFVRYTAQKIAEIRSMTLDSVLAETTQTAKKLFALSLLLIVVCATALAQPKLPNEDDYQSDAAYDRALENYELDSIAWARWIKPRKLGIGLSLGSNTEIQVQTFTQLFTRIVNDKKTTLNWATFPTDSGATATRSFDGIASFGGNITYGISDRIVVEGTYMYTKNEGPAKNFGLSPIVTNLVEATVHYSLNPYNKINFVAQLGGSYASISGADAGAAPSKIGVNAGLGLGINLPTSIGLFYPMFVLRYNFMLTKDRDRIIGRYTTLPTDEGLPRNDENLLINPLNPSQVSVDKADITTIYSLPRLTILFYPNF